MYNCDSLQYIADLVCKNYTEGYYPHWKIIFTAVAENDITQTDKEHIAWAIKSGYMEGEIVIDCNNPDRNGWWKIQFENT